MSDDLMVMFHAWRDAELRRLVAARENDLAALLEACPDGYEVVQVVDFDLALGQMRWTAGLRKTVDRSAALSAEARRALVDMMDKECDSTHTGSL